MRWSAIALLAVCLPGCKVFDAPDTIEELVVYGFVGFDEGADRAGAAATGLHPLLLTYEDDLLEGLRIDDLSQEDIDSAGVDTVLELGIVGLAAKVPMTSSLEDIAWAWSYPQMDEFLDVTTDFEVRTEYGDRDSFLAGTSETYAYDGWRQNDMGMLGSSEQEFTRQFQRTSLDDGTAAIVIRELIPDGSDMSSNLVRIDAQFSYTVLFADGDDTLRLDAYWIDAEAIGLELPDYFALEQAVTSMNATAQQVDAFIAEQ